ncbi:MAG: hypothetical protein HN855_06150 [Anaerolineae bacterium]|jgi:hypothetical protein|nr:hypothetical protein [Anaerolineae bacterium]MBT7070718.1 hypothetical protein [Anaerolineae bacterium]MBT7324720.1 hypothetical protein [Anaerolineae bacterium]
MLKFIKKKFSRKTIKGLYILTFTAEEMPPETLEAVIPIAEKMLKEKNPAFVDLHKFMQEDTPLEIANRLHNASIHNPHTMQVTLDTWLIGTHDVAFRPAFNKNFFPHAMQDPQGRENFFLYYFDVEEEVPPKKFSLVDMFE